MRRIINELTGEKGIPTAEANYIFTGITSILVTKIPELKDILEDMFEESDDERLNEHIFKMAAVIQEKQWKEKFKHFQLPPQTHVIIPTGGKLLF